MKKLMFICTGNTCRSAMCQCIMRNLIKKYEISGIKVCSAGLNVTEEKINSNAKIALKSLGINSGKFKAKQVTKEILFKQDLVICMTENQKNYLGNFKNVYTFNSLFQVGDIIDPYGQSLEVYLKTATLLQELCEKLIILLKEEWVL